MEQEGAGSPTETGETSKRPVGERVAWAVVVGCGIGMLLTAIGIASLMIAYGVGNKSEHYNGTGDVRFSDIRLPLNSIVIGLSLVVLALTVCVVVRRSDLLRAVTVFAAAECSPESATDLGYEEANLSTLRGSR